MSCLVTRGGKTNYTAFIQMFDAHEKTLPRNYMRTTITIINKLGRVESTQTLPNLRDREVLPDRSSSQWKKSNAVQRKK